MPAFEDPTPEITYPCRWSYRIVGVSEDALRALIVEVCAEDEPEIHGVRPSRVGTYVSIHLSITVRDETHRTTVYRRLSTDGNVKTVL